MSEAGNNFALTPDQEKAALERSRDIIVTAGAGSGKTRTLVGRYLSLLEEGVPPGRIAAITFTRKAAREMRNRVREALRERLKESRGTEERQRWEDMEAAVDAARIGTIHSLCNEILRAHPAEAGIDPAFSAVDEGISETLRTKAVEEGLNQAVEMPEMRPLFENIRTNTLQEMGRYFLSHRLDAAPFLAGERPGRAAVSAALGSFMERDEVRGCLGEMRGLERDGRLLRDAGKKLADQVRELLDCFEGAEKALSTGDAATAAQLLFRARRKHMQKNRGGSNSAARLALEQLQEIYDSSLQNWLGGKLSTDKPPDPEVERLLEGIDPLLAVLFGNIEQHYRESLAEQGGLDYDDLEAGALRLLEMQPIAAHWQGELAAVLVDEFQDTNQRQREIIRALVGDAPGRLFVVGDDRQSIYRFRGADVTVFRQMQGEIERKGGLPVNLGLTFRAHDELLEAAAALLKPVMGESPDPQRPYLVPFSALKADRSTPREGMRSPHLEFILGLGEDAASGRAVAAQALASRLLELRQEKQITDWGDLTLLFRAASAFTEYENAFEAAGIPFLTVAGSGFFDRPEVRDLLNILRALADPWDDLAVAGALRSPAFGLSDDALYNLRWKNGQSQALRRALAGELGGLDEDDRQRAERAKFILSSLEPWVERLPVSDLLERVIVDTDYRAVLATAPSRLWRNLDKLVSDARKSGLVQVRAFMEYLEALRDVGAREGEAPSDAEGAVRLMTIHKAKGLEFNVVVLADAARQGPVKRGAALLLPETGLTYRLDRLEAPPLTHRLAGWHEKDQEEAERKRLLYVALTRAKEKLIVSGYVKDENGLCETRGWLEEMRQGAGLDLDEALHGDENWHLVRLESGQEAGLWICRGQQEGERWVQEGEEDWPESSGEALFRPIVFPALPAVGEEIDMPPQEESEPRRDLGRQWRVTAAGMKPPAIVVGSMVHRAIQRWCFPGDEQFRSLMNKETNQAGLVDAAQRDRALAEVELLLGRLMEHGLWKEIDAATERYHELPYTRSSGRDMRVDETGYIDVLYRHEGRYKLVEFKTDALYSTLRRQEMIERYLPQLRRYAAAVQQLLGIKPLGLLCFLDDDGKVSIVEGESSTE